MSSSAGATGTSPTPDGPWVEQWLSAPRFAIYEVAAAGDRAVGLQLYEWNTAMSAAVLHDLAHLEIGLRNAYDRGFTMSAPAGTPHWTAQPLLYFPVEQKRAANGTIYDPNERPRSQIDAAVREAGPGATSGKVVAEFMFGFWRYLSTSTHEVRLWRPALHRGFVKGTSRRAVDGPMAQLHKLRNRVAHHEPLLQVDLQARYANVVDLAGLMAPELRTYVEANSTWEKVLAERPAVLPKV